jgi:hypothetical protein
LTEYRAAIDTLEWHDIIVMHRVPDDVPRLTGSSTPTVVVRWRRSETVGPRR